MKLYLIDDAPKKRSFLQQVIEAVNQSGEPRFEDGFHGAVDTAHGDPDALWAAVHDSDGVCCIDLSLENPENDSAARAIYSRLREEGASSILELFHELDNKINKHPYQLALLLLSICKQQRTKCLITSTLGNLQDLHVLTANGFTNALWPWDLNADNTQIILRAAGAIRSLLDLIGIFKAFTHDWFHEGNGYDAPTPYLPHTWKPDYRARHCEMVRQLWPFFPSRWWDSDQSAQNLHETLKHLCGRTVPWVNSKPVLSRTLSTGAVYLLVLIVLEQRFPGSTSGWLVKSFEPMSRATADWLGRQDAELAEDTIRSLIALLNAVLVRRGETKLGVSGMLFREPGDRLEIDLEWDARTVLYKPAQPLRKEIGGKSEFTLSSEGKTLGALVNFRLLSMLNADGFGSPGYLYLKERTLYVGA